MPSVSSTEPDRVREARRLAFHVAPVRALAPLRRLAAAAGGTPDEGELGWLLGATLGGLGRYADAVGVLTAVLARSAASAPAALADGAMASLLRQVGRHTEAEEHDVRAAQLVDGLPDGRLVREAGLDAAVGLVADAVGRPDLDLARDRLASADARAAALRPAAGEDGLWRPRVRLGWVATEVALMSGDGERALASAAAAVATARAADAPRHRAKSLLFLAVATAQSGDAPTGIEQLREVLGLCARAGTLPLVWPAHAVLAGMLAVAPGSDLPGRDVPAGGAEGAELHRRAGGDAVRALAPLLPEAWRAAWLAGPDVAWLTR